MHSDMYIKDITISLSMKRFHTECMHCGVEMSLRPIGVPGSSIVMGCILTETCTDIAFGSFIRQ